MSHIRCLCGNSLSDFHCPNDIVFWVFTDREWFDIKHSNIYDSIDIPFPTHQVWKCPECERVFLMEWHGDFLKTYVVEKENEAKSIDEKQYICSCGQSLYDSLDPSEFILRAFSDKEWIDMISIEKIDPPNLPSPEHQVLKCPVCDRVHVFNRQGKHRITYVVENDYSKPECQSG